MRSRTHPPHPKRKIEAAAAPPSITAAGCTTAAACAAPKPPSLGGVSDPEVAAPRTTSAAPYTAVAATKEDLIKYTGRSQKHSPIKRDSAAEPPKGGESAFNSREDLRASLSRISNLNILNSILDNRVYLEKKKRKVDY